MESRKLGQSPVKISRIVFGAWAIGGWMWGGTEEKESIEAIQAGIDNGMTTIDTAAIYGMGYSEELVAKAIKGRRERVVIATKCGLRWDTDEGSDPWPQQDASGKVFTIRKNSKEQSIFYECEQSLKRLGVDVIDLYQIHWPDSQTSIEDAWNAMVKLKQQGKVRAIGVSNYDLNQLREAHAIYPVDSIQPAYSLIRREIEEDIVPFCKQEQISILAYSPLERGLLTGKVTLDRQFSKDDHRSKYSLFSLENRKKILSDLEKIKPIAEKYHATLAQVVLCSTLRANVVDAVIVGARNASQAIENAKASTLKLTDQECQFVIDLLSHESSITK